MTPVWARTRKKKRLRVRERNLSSLVMDLESDQSIHVAFINTFPIPCDPKENHFSNCNSILKKKITPITNLIVKIHRPMMVRCCIKWGTCRLRPRPMKSDLSKVYYCICKPIWVCIEIAVSVSSIFASRINYRLFYLESVHILDESCTS